MYYYLGGLEKRRQATRIPTRTALGSPKADQWDRPRASKERASLALVFFWRTGSTHTWQYVYIPLYVHVCMYIYIYIYNIAIHTYIYIYTYTHRSEQGPADLGLQHHALRVDLRGVLDLSHYALLGWLVVLLCLLLSLVLYCNHIRVLVCI